MERARVRMTTAPTGGNRENFTHCSARFLRLFPRSTLSTQDLTSSHIGHILELHSMETMIDPSLPKQFLMRAHFNDSPSIQDDDSIRVLNGREPMGNHQGGSIFHQIAQSQLYDPFGLGV